MNDKLPTREEYRKKKNNDLEIGNCSLEKKDTKEEDLEVTENIEKVNQILEENGSATSNMDNASFYDNGNLEEANITKIAEDLKKVLTDNGAKIIEEKPMTQRELAYEIKKFKTGYYFFYKIETSSNDAINEFNRVVRINENVIRHLVLKVED